MFEHMTTAERIRAAKEKTERVVDHLLYLLALHENNAIIAYSDAMAAGITDKLWSVDDIVALVEEPLIAKSASGLGS